MNYLIYIIPLIATLASCSKINVAKPGGAEAVINFGTLNDKVTRAATSNNDNYRVYAKSSVSGENMWFINDEFNGQGADINKPVLGAQYCWPKSPETVSFWAYAPSSVAATATHATPEISIDYTATTGQEDFTIAAPIVNSAQTPTVQFQFSHMLAKITMNPKMSEALKKGGYDVTFASAELDVKDNTGNIKPTDATPVWVLGTANAATYTAAKSYMIIPDTPEGIKIRMKGVEIKKQGISIFAGDIQEYVLKNTNIPDGKFKAGIHYTLNFIISGISTDGSGNLLFGDQIEFDTVIGVDWGDGNQGGGGGIEILPPLPPIPDAGGILTLAADGKLAVNDPNGEILYFPFGGITASKATNSADLLWINTDIVFNPLSDTHPSTGYNDPADLPAYDNTDAAANITDISHSNYHNIANLALGKGDPCRLVGLSAKGVADLIAGGNLSIHNSGWKMQSIADACDLLGVSNPGYNPFPNSGHWVIDESRYPKYGAIGSYFPLNRTSEKLNFLPAAGFYSSGQLSGTSGQDISGFYLTSEFDIVQGGSVAFIYMSEMIGIMPMPSSSSVDFIPVRCVKTN